MPHHHHPHHHHHCEQCEVEAELECCECHEEACGHHHHHHDHDNFAAQLLELADQAWMEVLKEKIKDHIRDSNGKHLDKLAKLVAESNDMRWKTKLAAKSSLMGFKEKISQFFTQK